MTKLKEGILIGVGVGIGMVATNLVLGLIAAVLSRTLMSV